MTVKRFSGIAKERGNGWWAFCNQLPVCAHGETFNKALQNMILALQAYHEPLNGTRPPKMRRAPEQDGGVPFQLTVAVGTPE